MATNDVNNIYESIKKLKGLIASAKDSDCLEKMKGVVFEILETFEQQTNLLMESIEERKRIEDELRLFNRAAEQSANSIVITNLAGTILYVNKKFCDLTGYSKEEALGQNPRILKSGKQSREFYEKLWNTITAGKDWEGELSNKRKDGTLYWEHATISPLKNEKGKTTHYLAIKEDITEKKEAEEKLEKSRIKLQEEIATKNRFFSIISHDLRSPFTALLGYAELLDEEYDDLTDEERKQYIHSLRETAQSTFELLESLLTWARAQTGKIEFKPEEMDLFDIAVEIVGLFAGNASNKEIKLNSNIVPNTIVFADKDMLKTILRNLISNALKFTSRGGEISVNYKEDEENHFISVKDTGVGLSDEAKEKIFKLGKRFTQLGTENESGTGFGLALVQELIKKHKGKIWVESEPGKGAEFIFTIPKNLKEIIEVEK